MEKDDSCSPYEVTMKLLSHRRLGGKVPFRDATQFAIDYELVPLMIHENYLSANNFTKVDRIANIIDSISFSDCMSKHMSNENDWTLLPEYWICASYIPASLTQGALNHIEYPKLLGRNNTCRGNKRKLRELISSMGGKLSVPDYVMVHECFPIILMQIIRYMNYPQNVISLFDLYGITMDSFRDCLLPLCDFCRGAELYKDYINNKQKVDLSKAYNLHHLDIMYTKRVLRSKPDSDTYEESFGTCKYKVYSNNKNRN